MESIIRVGVPSYPPTTAPPPGVLLGCVELTMGAAGLPPLTSERLRPILLLPVVDRHEVRIKRVQKEERPAVSPAARPSGRLFLIRCWPRHTLCQRPDPKYPCTCLTKGRYTRKTR